MSIKDEFKRVVQMSQAQACALSRLVQGDGELPETYDRLSDSLWTARWLGEDVRFELHVDEIAKLLAVTVGKLESSNWCDEDSQALQGVIRQLSATQESPASAKPPAKSANYRPVS